MLGQRLQALMDRVAAEIVAEFTGPRCDLESALVLARGVEP